MPGRPGRHWKSGKSGLKVSAAVGLIAALLFASLFSSCPALAAEEHAYPAFSPESQAPITITPENVDLFGEGRLDFAPDWQAFAVDPPAEGVKLSATVRLWLDTSGKPVSCDIGQSPLPQAATTGCAQLLRSARVHLRPDVAPFHRGFVDVAFVFQGSVAGLQRSIEPCPGYANTQIVYPPDEIPADQHLHVADGTFAVQMKSSDYPNLALKYDLKSRSKVLLGIDRLGRVMSCRPLSNGSGPNSVFLDNYSCRILPKRGEFELAPSAPTYTGLRYLVRNIYWIVPSDD